MNSHSGPIQQGGCWPTPTQEKLLHAALGDGEAALAAWQQWRQVFDFGRVDRASERLFPLLERNLRRLGVQDAPFSRFSFVARKSWCRNQMVLARGAQLLHELQEAGIPTLMFKGGALVLRYYEDFSLRPMNDFDVLVPTAQAQQAFQWMLSHNWEFDTEDDAALLTETYLKNLHGQGFRNAQSQLVDIHRHLLHHGYGPDQDADFWEASVPIEVHGVLTRTLCTSDHLLVALMHGVRWDDTSPLRWVADALVLLRAAPDEVDWNRIYDQARKKQLQLPVQSGLRYLKNNFGAPIPASVLNDLTRLPVSHWQKIEFKGRTTSHETHGPLMRLYLRYLSFNQWEISRGWQGKIVGLPTYLQHSWQLRSPWQVPVYAYVRGVRQLRAYLQARFR